jgi:hypothetical protein
MPKNPRKSHAADAARVRVQFDFSKASLERLDELQSRLQAHTRAEVLRHALQLFTECVEARGRGADVLIREPDGSLTKLVLLV